jgi:hypothetical protein
MRCLDSCGIGAVVYDGLDRGNVRINYSLSSVVDDGDTAKCREVTRGGIRKTVQSRTALHAHVR